jgi:RHH-type rel operon transcriptional repressor/antitoxin RelB
MSYRVLQYTHMNKTLERDEMAERTTFTFQTTPELKERLSQLAAVTRRSKAFLANDAVERYLSAEEEFVADVEAGLRDLEAGRTMTTAELKQSLHDYIDEAHSGKKPA